jgi:CubicO group peptidase (beta-lactamase class C family)
MDEPEWAVDDAMVTHGGFVLDDGVRRRFNGDIIATSSLGSTDLMVIRPIAAVLMAALWCLPLPSAWSATVPPGIVDPDVAYRDPMYRDPVLFWRLTSLPKDVFEPDDYFYWPVGVVVGAPGPFFPPARGRAALPAAVTEAVADWAERHRSDALLIVRDGQLLFERYWNGMQAQSLANGRAITRSVTPLLLGFAVAEGKLRLDDPIGRFLPEWAADRRGAITVGELASNVSGLEVAPSLPVTQVHGNKDLCLAYCGDVTRAALAYDFAAPPGTRFDTAQENTQLLALVIERATGVPIPTLLSERIWKPIGAADAALQLDRPDGVARVMCCMRATPRDWTRLGVLVMQNGRWQGRQVIPEGWVERMATPSARNPNFGLGLWLGSPYNARRAYFEGGPGLIPQSEPYLADDVRIMEGGGYRVVYMVPSQRLVIFRHGPGVADWDNAYLVNAVLRALPHR